MRSSKSYVSVHRDAVEVRYLSEEARASDSLATSHIRPWLDAKPRLKIIDKPVGKKVVKSAGYMAARTALMDTLPLLHRTFSFAPLNAEGIIGTNEAFVGLRPKPESLHALRQEENTLLQPLNIPGAGAARKLLIVARLGLHQQEIIPEIVQALDEDIEHHPELMRIELGLAQFKGKNYPKTY